ncbi:hypothetical protein Tco_1165708 [Tanacetum coccineum]
MYCDSKAAIAISCNPVKHSRTKHIDVRYHFIKEQIENGIIELFFVRTEYQLADLFTKALSEDRFKYLVRRLGMRCLTPEELKANRDKRCNTPKIGSQRNESPGALLHNTTTQDTRERPLNVSFEKWWRGWGGDDGDVVMKVGMAAEDGGVVTTAAAAVGNGDGVTVVVVSMG